MDEGPGQPGQEVSYTSLQIRKDTGAMKLSMWIVNDWLKDYGPRADIKTGEQTINGVRYLADDLELSGEYLYIGYSDQYIDKWDHNVICVNGRDLITLQAPDIYVIFNEIQKMLEFYNNWETGILQAVNEKKDLQTLLSLTAPVLRTGVAVSDYSLKLLGEARYREQEEKQQLVDGYLDLSEIRFIHEQLRANLTNHHAYVVRTQVDLDLNYNIYSEDDRLLCRFISLGGGNEEFLHSRMQITESFGKLLNLWFMLYEREVDHASLFLDILDHRETDPAALSIRLEGLGWGDHPQMQVIAFQYCGGDDAQLTYSIRLMEKKYAGLISLVYKEQRFLIANYAQADKEAFFRDLREITGKQGFYCGCSPVFSGLRTFEQNYQQACFAAQQGRPQAGQIYFCEDFAVEYMQSRFRSALETDVTSPALMRLKEYEFLSQKERIIK